MSEKKSLTQHWSEKEEYADKHVALRHAESRPSHPLDGEPVAAADNLDELFNKLDEMGIKYVSDENGKSEVIFFYNPAPGTIMQ